jgi:uncharacterized protein DUF3352
MLGRAFLLAALMLAATGCGGVKTGGGGSAGDALAYLAADSATVIFVSTDVDGDQWEELDRRVIRQFEAEEGRPKSLDEYASEAAKSAGVDWEDDVKPLLGNDIAIGIEGDPMTFLGGDGEASVTAALDTREGDVQKVLEKARFERDGEASGATLFRAPDDDDVTVAEEDGVLVFSNDENALRRALERRDDGQGLEQEAVEAGLSGLPTEALVRAFGTAERLADQEQLRRFASIPLVQALESWGLTVSFRQDDLNVDASVRLDGEQLDEADLPLVTGGESPEVVIRPGEISGGNRNQSQTTAFLLRALRAGYPDSRFVKAADAIEDELGIDFEREILRQFDGPSASYVSPDGKIFAARSEVRDPEALKAVLPKIAPHLPALIEGLQGLESQGMALLFLFAPDAPAAAPMQGVKVDPPATEDGFYRISGLTGEGPSELYLGLVGDVFVVASDEQRAREIANADTEPADGAKGAGVLRADLTRLGQLTGALFFPIKGKELVASLEASIDELRARVRVELDD